MNRLEDMHIHTTFSDGEATVEEVVTRAEALGLERICIVDHVWRTTRWLGEWRDAVRLARRHRGVEVALGVEAKLLDSSGTLDLPPLPEGIDYIYVADHQWPLGDGILPPRLIRERLGRGDLDPDALIACLTRAYRGAVRRHPRVVLAHPFSILPKVGIPEDRIDRRDLAHLVEVVAEEGARIEISERWRCPSPRTTAAFLDAGVPVFWSTDSHDLPSLGRYGYVPRTWNEAGSANLRRAS